MAAFLAALVLFTLLGFVVRKAAGVFLYGLGFVVVLCLLAAIGH